MFTFYYAKVTDNCDPEKLNRVKVVITGKEESVSDWTPVITSYGGADTGFSSLPDIDDQVIVGTLNDSNTEMVVIGTIWSSDNKPPASGENGDADFNQDGKNSLHFFKSRGGNSIILDDTEGAAKISFITTEGKTRLDFQPDDEICSFATETDIKLGAKGKITLNAEEIELSAEKSFNIDSENYAVKASKEMNINADKDITIKGSGIGLN